MKTLSTGMNLQRKEKTKNSYRQISPKNPPMESGKMGALLIGGGHLM